MIRNEYLRFMNSLNTDETPADVKKLANIILSYLEDIAPLGTGGGRRIKKIVEFAQKEFVNANCECSAELEEVKSEDRDFSRLKSLTVGPFRGFSKQEIFELDSDIVLIFGPNGSGKSSFCEALEYALLGSVVEAESKRFRDTCKYLKNAYLGRFEIPVLKAKNSEAESIVIEENEASYRFCFIEKTRIDNFSRIAAHAPARQTELISTLFGLDSFNDFVKGFTTNIDERYIDLIGKNAHLLQEKYQKLEADNRIIKQNTQTLEALTAEEKATANLYNKDMSFGDLLLAIGSTEQPGEIQNLEAELQKSTPELSELKHSELLESRKEVEKTTLELQEKESELKKHGEELSYKQLYQAVIALTTVSKSKCPACKTPISQTVEDPFRLAEQGLENLEHLVILEEQLNELKMSQLAKIKNIYEKLKTVLKLCKDDQKEQILEKYILENETSLNAKWWQNLIQIDDQKNTAWQVLEEQIKNFEAKDKVSSQEIVKRKQKIERLKDLRKLSEKATVLKIKRETLEIGITNAQKAISSFKEGNKPLIEAVEKEKAVVAQNKKIASAYSHFVNQLYSYKDSLPGLLVADLAELVVKLYNGFNRSDSSNDLLADLKLPTSPGEGIRISFNSDPNSYFDALHVLSEGHIRCVGLAILLAKNLKENLPLVIFDDPVNAIDDDHRESIRRTLFEDEDFQNKQVILTCHGEEFFKDIQNLLGAEKSSASQRLTFLPQLGDKHIRVDFNSAPRNYIVASKTYLDKLEIRNSLEKARQALESLTKSKIWRYVSKHGDGNLSIKLRTANSPIELRNLTEQLKKKLSQPSFTHPDRDSVLNPINHLLGLNGDSREWRYLNKGTHEELDREEFDCNTVREIVNSLSTLDSVLS